MNASNDRAPNDEAPCGGDRRPASEHARVAVGTARCGLVAAAAAGVFVAGAATAQMPDSMNAGRSGVYRTAADFAASRLDFAVNCGGERRRIDRHTVRGGPYVDVTHAGRRTRLAKREVFGVRDCDGRVTRFAVGEEYAVLASAPITLYERPVVTSTGKGFRWEPAYFFSRAPDGPVLPLTRTALKDAFPADHDLHDRLDAAFRSDAELTAYDERHRQYRVLRVLARRDRPAASPD